MARYVSGTRFQHITVRGIDIGRTSFGDGFDTGDILVRDNPDYDGRPRFLVIVTRDGDSIGVAEVGTILSLHSLDSGVEAATPALGVTVSRTHGYVIRDGVASYPDGSGVARPWDGNEVPVAA